MKTLIFGGSGRIGNAICNLLKDDYEVYNADIRNEPIDTVRYLKCNIYNLHSTHQVIETVEPDIIIDAAYVKTTQYGKEHPFPMTTQIDDFIHGNLLSAYDILYHGYTNGCRNMVFISSIYGTKTPEFWMYNGTNIPATPPEYAMCKAALNQMVRYYSKALPDIKINAVAPGGIKDNMDPQFIDNYESKGKFTDLYAVANTVKWLIGQEGITGQVITVDNGWSV